MPYLNEHTVIGHLGQKPEVKYTPAGKAVANFSIATTEKWKDANSGEPRERTDWHNIVVWGSGAEFAGNYLDKGDLVMVKAPSRTRAWEDKDGNKRYTTEIVCTRFEHMLALKTKSGPEAAAGKKEEPAQDDGFDEDDIPF